MTSTAAMEAGSASVERLLAAAAATMEKARYCWVMTVAEDGSVNARPMGPQKSPAIAVTNEPVSHDIEAIMPWLADPAIPQMIAGSMRQASDDVRFCSHNGLELGIAPCPRSAIKRHAAVMAL